MPTKRVETSLFVLFVYKRQSEQDLDALRAEVGLLARDPANLKDIVIDFSSCSMVLTAEISLIIELLKSVRGTSRHIRLVPSVDLRKKLELLRIDKSSHLKMYHDRRSFLKECIGDRMIS